MHLRISNRTSERDHIGMFNGEVRIWSNGVTSGRGFYK